MLQHFLVEWFHKENNIQSFYIPHKPRDKPTTLDTTLKAPVPQRVCAGRRDKMSTAPIKYDLIEIYHVKK